MMGGAGLVSCLTFIWLSAPDLALTQLLVEIVTTALLLLGLRWLPKRVRDLSGFTPASRRRATLRRGMDMTIAIVCGLSVAVAVFVVMATAAPDSISRYFLERSYSDAGGLNVVNVLLVDFRAFDTLGEMTVLGVVALTVFALLRRFRPAADSLASPVQQLTQNVYDRDRKDREIGDTLADYMLVPRVIMKWLFPAIIVFAIYLFM